MRYKDRRPISKRKTILLKMVLLLVLLAVSLILFDRQIRPVITTFSTYQAKVYGTRALNEAVSEELARSEIDYDSLVRLSKNEAGEVTAIETDVSGINQLKANITDAVLKELEEIKNQKISIPAGTLTGLQILSGRGPLVDFKMVPSGYVQSGFQNRFDAVGINQVRHQILLNLQITISVTLPGYSVTAEVSTSFCVAETVIVGVVPGAYTDVTDNSSSLPAKIFDYGADKNPTNSLE